MKSAVESFLALKAALGGMAFLIRSDEVGVSPRGSQPFLALDLAGARITLGLVFHADIREAPRLRVGRDEGDEASFFVALIALELVGNEVTQGGAGALQLVRFSEMDDEHIGQLTLGRFEGSEPLAAFDVGRKGIGHAHVLRLGFVEAVAQVVDKVAVALLVECGFEGLANEALGGSLVHKRGDYMNLRP